MFLCQKSLGDLEAVGQSPAYSNGIADVCVDGVGDRSVVIKSHRYHSSPDFSLAYAVSRTYLCYVPCRLKRYQQRFHKEALIPDPLRHQNGAPPIGMNASPEHPLTATFDLPSNFDPGQHFTLKGFSGQLRSNDSRADFFAAYRKKAGELDRDYAREWDGNLYPNTRLNFVSESIPTRSSIVCPLIRLRCDRALTFIQGNSNILVDCDGNVHIPGLGAASPVPGVDVDGFLEVHGPALELVYQRFVPRNVRITEERDIYMDGAPAYEVGPIVTASCGQMMKCLFP